MIIDTVIFGLHILYLLNEVCNICHLADRFEVCLFLCNSTFSDWFFGFVAKVQIEGYSADSSRCVVQISCHWWNFYHLRRLQILIELADFLSARCLFWFENSGLWCFVCYWNVKKKCSFRFHSIIGSPSKSSE
jgi:hypothetical protein